MTTTNNPKTATTQAEETLSMASTQVPAPASEEPTPQKRQSWLRRHLPGGNKDSSSKTSTSSGRKDSISDSGPYIFAFDPNTGKEVLQKNPHWPNEDTWKREEETKGQWAMGGEMGQANKDFGGTVG